MNTCIYTGIAPVKQKSSEALKLNRLENREWDFATVERDVSKVRDISSTLMIPTLPSKME